MECRASTVGLSLLLLQSVVYAQTPSGDTSDTPPRLKLAPVLVPPPPKALKPGPGSDRDAVYLRADLLEGESEKWVQSSGKVELRTRRETVLADWLHYDLVTEEVWAKGNVLMRRGADWISGPEAKFKRGDETGFFHQPEFHIGDNASRGDAKDLLFVGENRYELKDFRYTTCVAGNDDWYLTSREVDLDRSRLVGTARNASIIFKGVSILYSPYLDFPLSNERKSGFLTPVFGSTSSRGIEMSIPYYLNLAPNYDATLTPRVMTRRGLQINGQARYLFPDMAGEADAEVLPDRITGTNRYGLSWKHNQNFGFLPGLAGYVNIQKVSDDAYFTDLSDRLVVTSQSTLPREGGFVYNRGPFSLLTRIQRFQTLQDPANPITPPYFREPQLLMTMSPVEWKGLDFQASGEFVRFHQSALVNGDRTVLYPSVTWAQRGNAWFVNARTGLHMTHYDLDNATLAESHLNRVVPISSVDGGLVFERDANLFGKAFTQTLEPRAYYVYIPYRRQDQIPAFDTAIDEFNFSQLFTENRYLGSDRIGDANQLTLAAVTRFSDPQTGEERMRFAIGQRYYFQDQRVTLTEAPRTANTSDLLLSGEGRLSDAWSAAGTFEYNLNHPQTERLDLGVRWQPGPGRVLNASYRYIRQQVDPTGNTSQLKQVDFSGQWPFLDGWSVIGRWNYSLVDGKTLEGVAGLEYNGGCWAFRIVGQRLTTTTQLASKSVFVQFELNGLARLGTNPIDVLKRSVPGYMTVTDPALRPAGTTASDYFPEF
ncbi:MAG: LPS-assembly protein LptD [Betaproteobacteria bacterium]|nr:MAG: LPS-assembly protein LptD [Betaproteobacteria bacterium]